MENPDLEALLIERQRLLMPVIDKLQHIHSTPIYARKNIYISQRLAYSVVLFGLSYMILALPRPEKLFLQSLDIHGGLISSVLLSYQYLYKYLRFLSPVFFYASFIPLIILVLVLFGNYFVLRHPDLTVSTEVIKTSYKLDRLIELFLETYRNSFSQNDTQSSLAPKNKANTATIVVEPAFECLTPTLKLLIFKYKCINSLLSAYLVNSSNPFKFPQWRHNKQIAASLMKKKVDYQLVRKYVPIPNTNPLPTSTSPPHPVILQSVSPDILEIVNPRASNMATNSAKSLKHRAFSQVKAMGSKGLYGKLPQHAYIRPLGLKDIDQCVELENAGHPANQRASKEQVSWIGFVFSYCLLFFISNQLF